MNKEEKNIMVFKRMLENYNNLNKKMVDEMELVSKHNVLTGNYREEMWLNFFRGIIPKKFSIAQGVIIIDSDRNVSKEVDIAVYDEQYTPYVFQYGTLKFIPIEAVSIVIECKSKSYNEDNLVSWAKSIDELNAKCTGIARMANGYVSGITNKSQIKTTPIKILACIKENRTEKHRINLEGTLGEYFDFIIQKLEGDEELFQVFVKYEAETLGWWGEKLNGAEQQNEKGLKLEFVEENDMELYSVFNNEGIILTNTLEDLKIEGNPFLTLNLQLNQLLMLINNPMLFPHFEYAKVFNDVIQVIKADKQNLEQPV